MLVCVTIHRIIAEWLVVAAVLGSVGCATGPTGGRSDTASASTSTSSTSSRDIFDPLSEPYREALAQTEAKSPSAAATIRRAQKRLAEIKGSVMQWPKPYSEARASTMRMVHTIGAKLDEAAAQVDEDPLLAHETLASIRFELATFRDELGVDHPSDAMTLFHASVDAFAQRATGEEIDWEYQSQAVDRLRAELYELSTTFEESGRSDCKVWGLQQVVDSIASAVEARDAARLRLEAKNLVEQYRALFQSCG